MLRRTLAVCLCLLAMPGFAPALDLTTRPVSPVLTWGASDLERFDAEWIHVKFVEGSNAVLDGRRFVDAARPGVAEVNDALARAGVQEIRRTIPQHDRAVLREKKARAELVSGVVAPDLSLWFDVRVPGGRAEVARMLNDLNASPAIEVAHPAPIAEPAVIFEHRAVEPPVRGLTPDFTPQQGYLYATPVGLDAPSAWAEAGGMGLDMQFIDVELAWTENHEDFDFANHFFHAGGAAEDPNIAYIDHGTAVLGEAIGDHNGFGISGFAPDADYGFVAVTEAEWPNVPHRFQEAVDTLSPGDVWLIELQMYPPITNQATPMEWLQVNYDVIFTGVFADGVVCVEAGANGSQNLDAPIWGGVFNRNVRDSGAIMVAAGTPVGRVAEWFTNYGSRMDAHAWGSQIVTTGYGDLYTAGPLTTEYTANFGGTSGASPMVTGTALCLQGIMKAQLGFTMTPLALRNLITTTGIPHLGALYIGPRPDLGAAVASILGGTSVPDQARVSELLVVAAPNPFRGITTIRFSMPEAGPATLAIHDVAGRRVRTLLDGAVGEGDRRFVWDGRDDTGRALASGVYFYRLQAAGNSRTGQVQLLK
jgi:hypothetical protein